MPKNLAEGNCESSGHTTVSAPAKSARPRIAQNSWVPKSCHVIPLANNQDCLKVNASPAARAGNTSNNRHINIKNSGPTETDLRINDSGVKMLEAELRCPPQSSDNAFNITTPTGPMQIAKARASNKAYRTNGIDLRDRKPGWLGEAPGSAELNGQTANIGRNRFETPILAR